MKRKIICFFKVFNILVVLGSLSGCFGSSKKLPELAEVTGIVMIDGEPHENVHVLFEPQKIKEKGKARASTGRTDKEGIFKLSYNSDASGAIYGKHNVRIYLSVDEAENPSVKQLPIKYNDKTTLSANITLEGSNEFTFDLKTK